MKNIGATLFIPMAVAFSLLLSCSDKSEDPSSASNPSITGTVSCSGFITGEDQIKIMVGIDGSSEEAFLNSLVKYVIIYEPGTYTISGLNSGAVLFMHAVWEKKGEGFGGGGDKGSGRPEVNPISVGKEGVTGVDILITPIIPDDVLDAQLGTFVMDGTLASIPIDYHLLCGIGTTDNAGHTLTIRDSTNFYGRFIEIRDAQNSLSTGTINLASSDLDIAIEDDPDDVPSHTEVTDGQIIVYEYSGLNVGDTISAEYHFITARGEVQGLLRVIIKWSF